jgi:endonuclease/exonuclease/phosphatase family metal-dependent hydrolase
MRYRISSTIVLTLVLSSYASLLSAQTPAWKVAFYNIQSGKGEPPMAGHTAPFVDTTNCVDRTKPLNAWGRGLIQAELNARLNGDGQTIALGLGEAWLCGSPENVKQALGWKARTAERNGSALIARYGFAGPEQWIKLKTIALRSATDPYWVVRAPVCVDPACSRSIVVYAAHWATNGDQYDESFLDQARDTLNFMAQDNGRPHVLIGDLNAYEKAGTGPSSYSPALHMLQDANYVDVWPAVHGEEEGFTGMLNRVGYGHPEGYPYKRIDYVWLQGFHPDAMSRFGVTPPGDGGLSDHFGVLATISDLPPVVVADPREIVLYASSAAVVSGAWKLEDDATAAGGKRLRHPDAGAPKRATPMADPADYFELTFNADAGVPYRLWLRGRADRNFWGNDSVYVQFSDGATAKGTASNRIGTTTAAGVVLEDGPQAVISGWGWQDNGYGIGALGPVLYFSRAGTQTLRVQTREDGMAIDQIVLSAGRYLQIAPGSVRDDATILPR